ncbi:MAG: hypothetical protein IJ661_01265 [Lachnospiraceae bacterium]|nr:hypothetical protein [Lachnospiraceae bacterium]
MGRVWNALKYGDSETRRCIGSVILFVVIAIILIVVAGLTGKIGIFLIGMISGVVALIISQTFTLVDDDFVAEVGKDGQKDTVSTVSVKRNGVVSSSKHEDTSKKKDDEASEQEKDSEAAGDDINEDKGNEHTDKDRFAHYNQQMLKKVKKKYKVKKDHRPIMIDRSETYKIRECPAFIWRVHNKVFLLLLEKEPRKLCISRDMIHNVGYRPGVKVDRTKEYMAFHNENLITSVFSEYLPDYSASKVKNDPFKLKNLYTIYPDIYITNRSISQVMDLLYINFMPEDKITKSDKLNGFFKRIYAANILYKDRVYSINEYKDAVEKVLGEMAYAEMPQREYDETLNNLVKGHLISQEYADYYEEHRMSKG